MNFDLLVPQGSLKLIHGPHFLEPEEDISIGPRLLSHTVEKGAGSFARISRPKRTLALSSRDRSHPNFQRFLEIAQEGGFAPVLRSPGGRAVAYHEESIILDFVSSESEPRSAMSARFDALGTLFIEALDQCGIAATIGEIPREYCPGKHSVITKDQKLVGTAQRLVRGGWLLSASVIVRNGLPIRDLLTNIYSAMEFDMNPETIVALNVFDSTIDTDSVIAALTDTLRSHFDIEDCELIRKNELKVRELVVQ